MNRLRTTYGDLRYTLLISCAAALGGLLFGFDTGVISGAIPFITERFSLNAHREGFAVSNLIVGCILGASMSGIISDLYGRKKTSFFPLCYLQYQRADISLYLYVVLS